MRRTEGLCSSGASSRNKVLQTGSGWGCETTETVFSQLLEAGSPKSRCHQGHLPLKTLGKVTSCLFQPLVAPGVPWLWPHHYYLCFRLHMALSSVSVSKFSSTDMPTNYTELGSTLSRRHTIQLDLQQVDLELRDNSLTTSPGVVLRIRD